MPRYVEVQCDGLVGPTHHYAGLSHGNVASEANAQRVSYPRMAALQGLEKMRLVHALGIPQIVLPPHPRPNLPWLGLLGFSGSVQEMLASAAQQSPSILQAAWSASGMWAANMATVSPAPDTRDQRLHLTPANLASTLHREQEAEFNQIVLQRIFGQVAEIHAPLPACNPLNDEGAANHLRLSASHGAPGVEVFVYGCSTTRQHPEPATPAKNSFPARQTYEASAAVARLHGVENALFVQQTPEAIAAGVFHNDVIAMSNENLLIYHAEAFVEEAAFMAQLRAACPSLQAVRITADALPLPLAVASYFFNSQLLSLPQGGMVVLAPQESAEIPQAKAVFERLLADPSLQIKGVEYLNLRESMRNGGGPACLRLRVVLHEEALARLLATVVYSPQLGERLEAWIYQHYPERLCLADLCDAQVAQQALEALSALEPLLGLPELYTTYSIGSTAI